MTRKVGKKKITALAAAVLSVCMAFSACNINNTWNGEPYTAATSVPVADPESTGQATVLEDPENAGTVTTENFSVTLSDGTRVEGENGVYVISEGGEYTVSGLLEGGRIIVEAQADDEVKLVLSDTSISCATGSPILAVSAKKLTVSAKEGTYNVITDGRDSVSAGEDSDETDGNAAIFASCDLQISGKGTLIVTSASGHGIKSKDDLSVKNVTLKVTAAGNALRGNDEAEIESGSLLLISGGDGIKTSSSEISSKNNQKGNVIISGGQVDVYASGDGISAACAVYVSGDATVINIFTGSYSEYEGGGTGSTTTVKYLIVPTSVYSESCDYYGYFYNTSEEGVWAKAEYETMVYNGRRASYYGLKLKAPSGYANVKFVIVDSGSTPSLENCVASTSGGTVNAAMNGYLISSVTSASISGDWVTLTTDSGGGSSEGSEKGIKAASYIEISGGTVSVSADDDGIHANNDTLESGVTGTGVVSITGGTLTITAGDDGVHADKELNVSGGYINVVKSYEGLESETVNISGGTIYIYASDDGINAFGGSGGFGRPGGWGSSGSGSSGVTPSINISGGYVDVTTPSGDTDAIDSNGNFVQTGGYVLVKGGSSSGSMAGSVDVDGSISVTGGAIVALGGICETPSSGSVNTYISSGTSFSSGSYELTDSSGNVILSFTLDSTYRSVWLASDAIVLKETYSIKKDGSELLSWTQSSSTVGSAGGGSWGGGWR